MRKKVNQAMSMVDSQMIFTCGPYKGYHGRAEYDAEGGFFHGDVIGTRDVITFQGRDHLELQKVFADSVDCYLEMCDRNGLPPEKPFSGKFLARIKPEVHRKLSTMAEQSGKSLNQLVSEVPERQIGDSPAARVNDRRKSKTTTRSLKKIAKGPITHGKIWGKTRRFSGQTEKSPQKSVAHG